MAEREHQSGQRSTMEITEGIEAELGGTEKRLAVFITVIGLFLAIAHVLAQGAQTQSIAANVQASDLWNEYQAKSTRETTVKTAAEQMQIDVDLARDPAVKAQLSKRVAGWLAEVQHYESEPRRDAQGRDIGVGKKELSERAHAAEELRDTYTEKYHAFEIGAAAFQIAIVIAGVYLLTHIMSLLLTVGALTAAGLVFTGIGIFAPTIMHHIIG